MKNPHPDLPGYEGQATIAGIVSDDWKRMCCKSCGSIIKLVDQTKTERWFSCCNINCPFAQTMAPLEFLTNSK